MNFDAHTLGYVRLKTGHIKSAFVLEQWIRRPGCVSFPHWFSSKFITMMEPFICQTSDYISNDAMANVAACTIEVQS